MFSFNKIAEVYEGFPFSICISVPLYIAPTVCFVFQVQIMTRLRERSICFYYSFIFTNCQHLIKIFFTGIAEDLMFYIAGDCY